MNQKQIINGMMPVLARYNAALPPRWGRVVGAVKLVEMFHLYRDVEVDDFISFCASVALDAKSHGPFCRMAAAVARDIALADRDWRWEQRGVLMGLAHPEVAQILARGFEIGQLRREESVAYAAVHGSDVGDPRKADDVLEKARAARVAAWQSLTEAVAAAMQAGKIAPDWGAISYRELSGLTVADCVRLLDTEVGTPPHREAEAHELRALAEAAATVESSGTGA